VAASYPEWHSSRTGRFLALLFLGAVVASWRLAEVRPLALVQGEALHNLFAFASGMFPPAHSVEFLKSVARPIMETVQMARSP
jgi:phosphonate transport system permease protein